MNGFVNFIQAFLELGSTVILPIVIFLFGLFCRQKGGAAFRSGLTIGVAFVGIFLVIDLLVNNLGPAAQAMVNNLAVSLNVIDVGWPATSSIAWAAVIAAFLIPLGIVITVIMLLTNATKPMNFDILNV
ncbi:PTS galactitol transporter subunit IIC, partial [Staphylococcus sp. MB371]